MHNIKRIALAVKNVLASIQYDFTTASKRKL